MSNKLTHNQEEQIDNLILDLVEKIVPLMEAKGFDRNSKLGMESFDVRIWDGKTIEVESICQPVKTISREIK